MARQRRGTSRQWLTGDCRRPVTAATATQLTVTFLTKPLPPGHLTAIVTSVGGTSGVTNKWRRSWGVFDRQRSLTNGSRAERAVKARMIFPASVGQDRRAVHQGVPALRHLGVHGP